MTGCLYNYVVTAQRPTAVTHAVVGRVTSEHETDLIVGKSTSIELYTLQKGGLQAVAESPVNGRIAELRLFRRPRDEVDCVMLLTERKEVCTLRFDPGICDWCTLSTASLYQRVGNEAMMGPFAFIDPSFRFCAFHLYSSVLKVMSIEDGKLISAFSVRMEELNILHLCFLPSDQLGTHKPVLAVLYEDTRRDRHLKTYFIDIEQQELEEGTWMQYSMINAAEKIIPVLPFGGLILLGESMISYLSHNQHPKHIAVHETSFLAYGKIDANRYILSDRMGRLYMLLLLTANNAVTEMSCQGIGEVSPAAAIAYLDSCVVFVGSACGDSQLIKLTSDSSMQSRILSLSYQLSVFRMRWPMTVLNTYTNLGPIIDFCVVDLERQGQCQVVTCSGAYMQGSLRVIRNGIGITEQATIDLQGIKGLWSLRTTWDDLLDVFLVISFVNETRVLAFSPQSSEELVDAHIVGFQQRKQTLHCANVIHNAFIQVTQDEALLVSSQSLECLQKWVPRDNKSIILASSSPSQVLVACSCCELVYFLIHPNELLEEWVFKVEEEVSCLDLNPIGDDTVGSTFAAIGTWEMNLILINLRTESVVMKMNISPDIIPRSVLFSTFEGLSYLLVAMGDGRLITYDMDPESGALTDERHVSIGTKPIALKKFWTKGTSHVFASSDRPTVIYGEQKKLMFSNLNENNVNLLTSFHTTSCPDCLALAKEGRLTIGIIDDIQKLHIRSVYLKEMPRRICHQPETNSFGVLVEGFDEDGCPQSYFRIFDDETFEVKRSFLFDLTETGISIVSIKLPDRLNDDIEAVFFLVGTAYNVPTECEPQRGRILAFQYTNSQGHAFLNHVATKEFKGAVFSIKPILDKILATVSSKVHVLEWKVKDDASKEISVSCTQHCHILAVYSDVRSNFVVIGDLMRSISLLVYDREKNELEIRSRDTNCNWMSAVKALDDEIYLGSDNSYNLITTRKSTSAIRDVEGRLETVGQYHLGEFVNALKEGSLVARPTADIFIRPPVIFGTVNGQLGLILSLTKEKFTFLERLQNAMQQVVHPLGEFDHLKYRSFTNERRTSKAQNFIDGDLIETFLDLKRITMEKVSEILQTPREEIYRIVEDLSKLH